MTAPPASEASVAPKIVAIEPIPPPTVDKDESADAAAEAVTPAPLRIEADAAARSGARLAALVSASIDDFASEADYIAV